MTPRYVVRDEQYLTATGRATATWPMAAGQGIGGGEA